MPPQASALVRDLELETLFGAMAGGDPLVLDVARKTLLLGLENDRDTILYRQAVLRDCLRHPDLLRELYDLAASGIETRKRSFFGFIGHYPSSILHSAIEVLEGLVGVLRALRGLTEKRAGELESEGLIALFSRLKAQLSDDYFTRIEGHLEDLKFRGGILVSAALGAGCGGIEYALRKPMAEDLSWFKRILGTRPQGYSYRVADRDEAGLTALSNLRDRGIHLVANALAQSTDHILGFCEVLRSELAFYVGGVHLHGTLAAMGVPTSFPHPEEARGSRVHQARDLSDVCLALTMGRSVISNAVQADGRNLVLITGANQGGKSSFLRAIGLAQLMMQSGLFVAAESFSANLCTGLFTHYVRAEDESMKSGKLDEELHRMSDLADLISPGALLLFNESFASTNEREGSEIAAQIVRALLDKGGKVFFVTHLHAFARRTFDEQRGDALFLRAERHPDGARTFKIVEGEPLETSYGPDLYREIFTAHGVA